MPLLSKVITDYPDLKPAVSYDLYMWAWYTVNTRAVYMKQPPIPQLCAQLPDNMVLAPVLDFLNHSPSVEVSNFFKHEKALIFYLQCYISCNCLLWEGKLNISPELIISSQYHEKI